MPLFKDIKRLKNKLEVLQRKNADTWMGKWAKSIMIKSIISEIKELESLVEKRKTKNVQSKDK